MQPHLRSLVSAMGLAAWLAAPGVARAQMQSGPFTPGQPWFEFNGLKGVQPLSDTDINVDTDANGVPDTIFSFPHPIPGIVDARLSPTQKVLYTRSATTGCPNRVSFFQLDMPAAMTPLATDVCLGAAVAIGPLFYDPSPGAPIRTAVLVTETIAPTTFRQEVLWVDLVNGDHNPDVSTYESDVQQLTGIQFAPSGNAAFVQHGTTVLGSTPKYTLIDLCRSRIAGTGSTRTFLPTDFPHSGSISAHVVASNTGSFNAELWVSNTPATPAVGIALDNCLDSPAVSLELSKSPSGVFVSTGQEFQYALTVRNNGNNRVTSVVLEDTVPTGTTFVSASDPHSRSSNTVRWELGTIPAGRSRDVTLTVRPSCSSPFPTPFQNNQYTVVSDETAVLNGNAVVNYCVPPPPVVLSIAKAGPATVRQGDTLTYTLEYANTGTQTASGVIVEDTLPSGSVFVSATGNHTLNGSLVSWNVGTVASNGHGSVTLTVRAGCVPQIINSQYSIRSGSTGRAAGLQVVTNVTAASTAPVDVIVTSQPITRVPPLQRGDIVQHVITLRNTAAETRSFLRIPLSAGRAARFDQVIDPAGGNVMFTSAQTLEWTGSLAPHATASIIVTTRMEECLRPSDTFTQLNDGRPIEVVDVCNRPLGSQSPPAPFDVLPPVVASLKVLGSSAPPSGSPGIDGLVQAVRAGSTIDLQLTLVNQSPDPEASVSFSFVLPSGLTPAGTPPFVPPTHASAVYDDATRRISWNGPIDAGQTVLVTVRVQVPSAGMCSMRITASGSAGTCQNLGTNVTLLAVPDVPTEKHIIGTDHRLGLWMFTPGVDTAFRDLLCFPGEIYRGIDRAANGDVWVAGLPSYRLNPATLDLQVVDESTIRPPGFSFPVDVAVDPAAASPKPIFLVPDDHNGSRLVQFDPSTGLATVVRDGLPGMERIVIDRHGRIAGVNGRPDSASGTPAGVILVDPANPANDRMLSDPAFPSLDFNLLDADADGTFVVGVPADPRVFEGTQNLVRIDPGAAGPGTFSLIAPDLAAFIPPPPFSKTSFWALALGAGGDVYLGRAFNGSLGVLHGSTPSGEMLAVGRNVIDLEYVDPSAVPPPPSSNPVNIEVNETILVVDAVGLLPGIVVHVDEQVVINDLVDLLPGIVLLVEEQVSVDDTADSLPGILLSINEQIAVNDETEAGVPDNTPAGANVIVRLGDRLTGRIALTARFPLVTRSGMTAFTSRADGPAPPRGFRAGEPPIVYDVTTTAIFNGQAAICVDDSVQRFANPRPRLFHFEGGAWVDRTGPFDAASQFPCAIVATLSPFALFEAADRSAPVTTIAASPGPNAAGWNRTNVTLVVSAADEPNGSGVKHLHVSLAGAQTGTLSDSSAPIVITAEGTTTATYFAEDNAGNVEAAKTLVVRIDRTPPELAVRFDPATFDLAVSGADALAGVPPGPVHPLEGAEWRGHDLQRDEWDWWRAGGSLLRRYEVVDIAGNRLDVVLRVRPHCGRERSPGEHRLEATVVSLRYGGDAAQRTARNDLEFTWTVDRNGALKHLVQEMQVSIPGEPRAVHARFDAKRGVTAVRDGRNAPIERPGLVLLRLTTMRGELSIQW